MEEGNLVEVKGYEELGIGVIDHINNELDFPIFVSFLNKNLHESEKSGYFSLKQIKQISGDVING